MNDINFSEVQVADENCFLCGTEDAYLTQEHVFPKWLQHRYELKDKRLNLLNDTKIQYKNLLIPCCAKCNREDLSRLEKVISSAVSGGYEQISKLDPYLLYLWIGKLYFGVLRKEISLARDRSRPNDGTIISKETLRSFSALHLFLQGIRGKHEFTGHPPYSLLVCNLHDVGSPRNFFFQDSFNHMAVGLRLGEIGIIAALEDAGLTSKTYGRYIDEVAGKKLHPIQFDELYAKVLYQLSLVEGPIKYITTKHKSDLQAAHTLVLDGRFIHEWSQEEYSKVLRSMVSKWLHVDSDKTEWFAPPNLVPTWMTKKDGKLLLLPLEEWTQSTDVDYRDGS